VLGVIGVEIDADDLHIIKLLHNPITTLWTWIGRKKPNPMIVVLSHDSSFTPWYTTFISGLKILLIRNLTFRML
jgi:hypothetical protein